MGFHEVLRIKSGNEQLMLSSVLQSLCFFKGAETKHFVDVSQKFSCFEEALPEIVIQTRVFGETKIPDEWFPGPLVPESTTMLVPSNRFIPELPKWYIDAYRGYCAYSGQSNEFYSAVREYIIFMIEDHANHSKVGREIWMAVDYCILNNDIGGAIDCAGLISILPEGFPDVENIMKEALNSKYLPLNIFVADQFEFHPIQNRMLIEKLTKLSLDIKYPSQITRIIRGLRIIGGDDGFEALLFIAQNSDDDKIKIKASKALAWTKNLENIEQRIKKLIFSKDRKTSKIASNALSTLRNHTIYSDGAPFATKKEKECW